MKVRLPDALHARPANLLVRLAAQHAAVVEVWKGETRADARKILDVLALGAAKGDEIELRACGEGAEGALAALAELVARNFDGDLVPEVGSGVVEGIAIGRALLVCAPAAEERAKGSLEEEAARLDAAEQRALADLDALIAHLAPNERALFEPERAIVAEVAARARARVEAGEGIAEAIAAVTATAATDLILDARARLLGALAEDTGIAEAMARAAALADELVVVAEELTPSLVAQLPPHVRGIVAVEAGEERDGGGARTSHAAILARGREIPLAVVPSHVAVAIGEGDAVVVDTTVTPARVWVAPSEALLGEARARRARHQGADVRAVADAIAAASLALGVKLLVNVGSLHDRVPEGAAGVGLLRTELLFAARASEPAESEQVAALLAVARAARGGVVTARLWDAGGDKPLPWLPPRTSGARGAELLFEHPRVLQAQLAAIARAAEVAPVRALLPMARSAADVAAVRRLAPEVTLGAMIETPEAARDAAAIVLASDFVCIGTNDLAALVLGVPRGDAALGLDPRVLALVADVAAAARAHGKVVTVCGELAADPIGARVLVGLGVQGLSVAPPRLAGAAAALAAVTVDDCRAAAYQALHPDAAGVNGKNGKREPT